MHRFTELPTTKYITADENEMIIGAVQKARIKTEDMTVEDMRLLLKRL